MRRTPISEINQWIGYWNYEAKQVGLTQHQQQVETYLATSRATK